MEYSSFKGLWPPISQMKMDGLVVAHDFHRCKSFLKFFKKKFPFFFINIKLMFEMRFKNNKNMFIIIWI
jgi:hypothetical protein